ncbi:hypothetical protein [Clostridium sp. LIBA-8841]|uniref:hypothetical protein n=1 Tax=Clostridium sp. LIBA-8841 TaxID=2987530 RepID=UPI002AC3DBD7|nr:hypothetical protein [Clostridium sp. LIBA-8841]MDZ5253656.1 hypothetical protein [Clostridium sp. LIBA-8841]
MNILKSKGKIIIISLVILLLCIVSGNILINKFYNTNYNNFNSVDKEMFNKLSDIYKEFHKNGDQLWPDYDFEKMPLILIRTYKDKGILRKYAYAINVEGMKEGIFSKEVTMPKDLDLPKIYRISSLNPQLFKSFMPGNFGEIDIKGQKVFYFKYNPKMIENPDLYFDFSSFLLHESFHTYKQENWEYDKNDGEYIENYPNNKGNYALIGVEFSLLDKALETNNKEDIEKYLKDWTIIRTYRYEKWPQLKNETNTEAIEGTARYMEYEYSKLTGGKLTVLANKEAPYHVSFIHAFNYIANGEAESPEFLKRPMRYEVGAALGLLMDELNINWKSQIEDSKDNPGETQYEILKKYFNITDKDVNEKTIKSIEDENNYNELLKQGEKIVNLTKN